MFCLVRVAQQLSADGFMLHIMVGLLSKLLNRSKVARPGGHHYFLYKITMRVNIPECTDNISEHIKNTFQNMHSVNGAHDFMNCAD